MLVNYDCDIRKHVRLQTPIRIWDCSANLDAACIRIDYAGNQDHFSCEGRSRKRGDGNLHLLAQAHALEVLLKHVAVDPDLRDVDDLEDIRIGSDSCAQRSVAFDYDSRDGCGRSEEHTSELQSRF